MAVAQYDTSNDQIKRLEPKKILALAEQRLKTYARRNEAYDTYLNYYLGKPKGDGSGGRTGTIAMNSQGRPLLRDVELGNSMNANRAYTSQRLAPIVDDYAALLGRMPTSRVEAPDSTEQAQSKAELLTKYLIDTHTLSDMDRQQAEAGFHLSGLGDNVYMLEVDPEIRRVVWSVVSPRVCYPSFYRGYKRFQLYDLVVQYQWDPDSIEREFGYKPSSEDKADSTVTIYVSPHQRTVVIGLEAQKAVRGPHVEWDLGFCPAQWVFNKVNGQMASSDIAGSLGQQDFLDFAFNVLADGIVFNTYPLVGVRNPNSVGEAMIVGPGAPPVPLGPDGDIIVRQTQGDIRAAMSLVEQAVSDINTSTGSSSVRQEGQMKSSITTGRAVHAVQGPQSTRVELKQAIVGAAIENLNAQTLAMQELAPYISDKPITIFRGKYKGRSFNEQLDPKKDIDGWTRNTVTWDTLVGMNLQQRVQLAYEGKVAKLWDDLYAAELVGVEDPIGMRERIEAQMVSEAKMQAQVQQMAAPAGAPGATGVPPQASGAPAGGPQQQTPQAPMIMRPPGLGAQQGVGASSQMITQERVRTALGLIADRLKGEVYGVGAIANGPVLSGLQLAITDPRDHSLVTQAARAIDPMAKVRAITGDRLPPEAVKLA